MQVIPAESAATSLTQDIYHALASVDVYQADHAADGTITITTDLPDNIHVMGYAESPRLRREPFLPSAAGDCHNPRICNLGRPRDRLSSEGADLLAQVDVASRVRAREFHDLQEFVRSKDPYALPLTLSNVGSWWSSIAARVIP